MRHAATQFRGNIRNKYRTCFLGAFIRSDSISGSRNGAGSVTNDAPWNGPQSCPCFFNTVRAAPNDMAQLLLPVASWSCADLVDHQNLQTAVRSVLAIDLAIQTEVRAHAIGGGDLLPPAGDG